MAFCAVLPISIAGLNIGMGLVTVALLLHYRKTRSLPWTHGADDAARALCIYLVAALLTSAFGLSPSRSFHFFYKDLHKAWIFFLLIPALGACRRAPIHWALGAGFAAIAGVGIAQSLTQRYPGTDSWVRAHGFVHAVTFGEQMALALLGGLCFLKRKEADTVGARATWILWAFLVLIAAALLLSQTRGAFLGFLVGFGALCLVDEGMRGKAAAMAGLSLGAFALLQLLHSDRSLLRVIPSFGKGYADLLTPQLQRVYLWDVALKIFKDHPLFGVGPDNYGLVFNRYFHMRLEGETTWGSAHNLYLHQLAERGLLGLLALAALLYALAARAHQRAQENPNAWNLLSWAAIAGFLAMNLTEVAFQSEQMATLVLFLWAWAEANHHPLSSSPIT